MKNLEPALITEDRDDLMGWKSRKLGSVSFYRCPGCGGCQEILLLGPDKLAQCFACNNQFPTEQFGEVARRRIIAECGNCGNEVSLTPANRAFLGYICAKCDNYVGICYGLQTIQPKTVLDPTWNPRLLNRTEPGCGQGLLFGKCSSVKDWLVLNLLQSIVKKEDSRFLFADRKDSHAGLLIDFSAGKYLGFLVWTEDKFAVLRQIFIIKDARRKGHAQNLVRFWIERYADRLHDQFGIEAPNESALALHVKLGHIELRGDTYHCIKAFRVPSW